MLADLSPEGDIWIKTHWITPGSLKKKHVCKRRTWKLNRCYKDGWKTSHSRPTEDSLLRAERISLWTGWIAWSWTVSLADRQDQMELFRSQNIQIVALESISGQSGTEKLGELSCSLSSWWEKWLHLRRGWSKRTETGLCLNSNPDP